MGTLAALVFATPIYGLALTPPSVSVAPVGALPDAAVIEAQLEAPAALTSGLPPMQASDMRAYAETMKRRSSIAAIHRPLGIATWASMGVTLLLGGIQYHNLYGTFSALEDTPCVQGSAIFGQGQCSGTPVLHLTSAMVTTALYSATFALSVLMPDPGELDEGDSEFASNLRMHKLLRWVHFLGMVSQIALGIVVANADAFGLDRANDFGTMQALATVHMGLGFVTYGALTWAGALMVL
jgi:hypothetical protein